MRSTIGRFLLAKAARRLAARLTPQQAQTALAAINSPKPVHPEVAKAMEAHEAKAKDRIWEAVQSLPKEQVAALPPAIAQAILEIRGHRPADSADTSSPPPSA
jgi:hypothetical protein